jgi:hypothetical protein
MENCQRFFGFRTIRLASFYHYFFRNEISLTKVVSTSNLGCNFLVYKRAATTKMQPVMRFVALNNGDVDLSGSELVAVTLYKI